MKINIVGKHVEVTEGIRTHAEKMVSKIKHYKDTIPELDMVVEKEHLQYKASVTFDAFKKKHHVESKDSDLYDSIDKLMDKVERSIRKHKEKIEDHSRRMSVSEASSIADELNED